MEAKRYFVPTPYGEVSLVFAPKPREEVVVIIHGAGRRAFQLRSWLAYDAVRAELPGHDQGPEMAGLGNTLRHTPDRAAQSDAHPLMVWAMPRHNPPLDSSRHRPAET
ncbi:MAG: hypothetical protein Q7S93_02320 [Phenylobacterium sp.]|uniref:hypothetical protein n=1 Tax=Phenylobacterium sp. TaxID=1871053 RepID=UPI00271F0EB6|nr:hypothetical protein [Phenylobacterium sp.]MDO8408885.1 hypothetical protein [Phenylobacterium sp.]